MRKEAVSFGLLLKDFLEVFILQYFCTESRISFRILNYHECSGLQTVLGPVEDLFLGPKDLWVMNVHPGESQHDGESSR